MDTRRVRSLVHAEYTGKNIAYWMSRDQRVHDNWALIHAQNQAHLHKVPLLVFFSLTPHFLGATQRQYDFMLKGLREVEKSLHELNIPFYLLIGSPEKTIPEAVKKYDIGLLVTDFSPLTLAKEWKQKIASQITIPFQEVDAHNIIPCWEASNKQEYAAFTFRKKVHKLLPEYLTDIPHPKKQAQSFGIQNVNWNDIETQLKVDTTVKPVDWILPGEKQAHKILSDFIKNRLTGYDLNRNNPEKNFQSDLSPYLHFGHISAQRIAWEVQKIDVKNEDKTAFLEELIVRRELSDNYCYYNSEYTKIAGLPQWAQKTLKKHEKDTRPYLYTLEELEKAKTHDAVWNAAQGEMVKKGKMHGYMRMYWAKKILEWTSTPEKAIDYAIYLNDKYELDGRDPNGYVGILWSIGGLHDRPWFERHIFGQIRYMSGASLQKKFKLKDYLSSSL